MSHDTQRVSVDYAFSETENVVRCTVNVHDPTLIGRTAELRLRRTVKVHDGRAVNESDILMKRRMSLDSSRNEFELHRSALKCYSYIGQHLSITLHTEVEIDNVLFDTVVREDEQILLSGKKPMASDDAKGTIEPRDSFELLTNLRAIPRQNRLMTYGLLLAGAVVIALNSWIGVRDQLAPEGQTLLYSQRDSDGDAESPLQHSLMVSGLAGAAIWFAVKKQLRTYMSFRICNVPQKISRHDVFPASAILAGKARVNLHDVRLRIVACNMEKGQYKRGSGSKVRTVSFKEPVRAVVLYSRSIPLIPAGEPVERYFDGEIAFEPMFAALYPPQEISRTHGLSVYWEVQLIHDELIDQELQGPIGCFHWQDFLEA